LHTQNHLIKEIGLVRHPAKRTRQTNGGQAAGKRRISIEEPTGTCYTDCIIIVRSIEMKAQTLIRDMEADIQAFEEKGITEIKLKNFKAYLEEIKEIAKEQEEKDALQTQRDLAFYAAKNTAKIAYYNARMKRISDGFHAVITIGQGALKSGALINGGACVALLAFIGNILTKDASMISGLSTALLIFGGGVLFAAISSGTTYLAQESYERKKRKKAFFFQYLTIAFVSLSYLAFLLGGLQSWRTIYNWESQKPAATAAQQQGKIKDSDEFRETNNELSEQEALDEPVAR